MLESQPSAPTKEKRFAFSLYMDTLALMVSIARRVEKRGGSHPLMETRFIKRLQADEQMKKFLMRYGVEPFAFQPCVEDLAANIKESNIYKNFLKDFDDASISDVHFWKTVFDKIIMTDALFNTLITKRENYTLRGVERFKEMINTTFETFLRSQDSISEACKELKRSLDKARELYMRMLYLPVELVKLRELQMEEAKNKYLKTHEDIYPNLRFVDNELVKLLRENTTLNDYVEKHCISMMVEDRRLLESLLKSIMSSELYEEYMSKSVTDLQTDIDFWRDMYRKVIFNNSDLLETLETMSVFWNDDLDIVGDFVIKTFRRFADTSVSDPILPQYKDDEDARFGSELFTLTVKNKEEYRRLVEGSVNKDSWDTERLAFMDVVILITAITEILNFPSIPLNVSVNEYIEVAKAYSTEKSGMFVHGILGAVIQRLKEENKLMK